MKSYPLASEASNFLLYDTYQYGKGIKTLRDLAPSEVLLQITGPVITYADTIALQEKESYCLQIGHDQYIFPNYPFYFLNHSCEPNCGINDKLQLVTIRYIKGGEPLSWDYSTSMLERAWRLNCACGAPGCRKLINDFDTLPVQLQAHYLDQNLVLPFIARKNYPLATACPHWEQAAVRGIAGARSSQ